MTRKRFVVLLVVAVFVCGAFSSPACFASDSVRFKTEIEMMGYNAPPLGALVVDGTTYATRRGLEGLGLVVEGEGIELQKRLSDDDEGSLWHPLREVAEKNGYLVLCAPAVTPFWGDRMEFAIVLAKPKPGGVWIKVNSYPLDLEFQSTTHVYYASRAEGYYFFDATYIFEDYFPLGIRVAVLECNAEIIN